MPRQRLHIATLGGRENMGMSIDRINIEVGKQADLICVDLSAIETQPIYT